jgi:hypothetical protein
MTHDLLLLEFVLWLFCIFGVEGELGWEYGNKFGMIFYGLRLAVVAFLLLREPK